MHTNDLRKLARETNDGVLRGPALGEDEIPGVLALPLKHGKSDNG